MVSYAVVKDRFQRAVVAGDRIDMGLHPSPGSAARQRIQNRYEIPACFMMAFAVCLEAQFVETVTHSFALHPD